MLESVVHASFSSASSKQGAKPNAGERSKNRYVDRTVTAQAHCRAAAVSAWQNGARSASTRECAAFICGSRDCQILVKGGPCLREAFPKARRVKFDRGGWWN